MEEGMQNNDRGNNKWRDKLEDAGAFEEGILPATDATWDKLYVKLQQPPRKNALRKWAAAATILMGVTITMLFSLQLPKQEGPVVKTSVEEQPGSGAPLQKNDHQLTTSIPVVKKRVMPSPIKQMVRERVQKTIIKQESTTAPLAVNNNRDALRESSEPLPVMEQSLSNNIASIPQSAPQPRPKLKVVHVNELGSAPNNNQNRPAVDYSVIQFGVSNQQLYNKGSLPPGKIGLRISTGKPTSSN